MLRSGGDGILEASKPAQEQIWNARYGKAILNLGAWLGHKGSISAGHPTVAKVTLDQPTAADHNMKLNPQGANTNVARKWL